MVVYKNTVYPDRRNESFGRVFLYAFFMEAVQQFSGAATPPGRGPAVLASVLSVALFDFLCAAALLL
ncbi:MAG: hypothetical protein IPJ73_05265 [Zoogloea sp.]|nr:hypothetical protein [Zoogloea sp.]